MPQHDMNIANQGFPSFRADLNNALGALVSNSSGATAPATTFAHQYWVDTSANPSILKIRNADNDAFITIGTIDQTGDTFTLTSLVAATGGSINNTTVGASTPSTGAFTTLAASSAVTFNTLASSGATLTGGTINGTTVGASTPATGSFTTLNTSGQVVFNDAGADVDFRVEGDTNANLLFVDASADSVGIGTTAPSALLTVSGTGASGLLTVNRTDGSGFLSLNSANGVAGVQLSADGAERLQIFTNVNTSSTLAATFDASGNLAVTGALSASANMLFNSGFGSVGLAFGCRAWVNFNGTGTPAIRGSGNVSSITDNGTGDYTVNFTTAMPDANYSMGASAEVANGSGTQVNTVGTLRVFSGTSYATGSVRVVTNEGAIARVDSNVVSISIFR